MNWYVAAQSDISEDSIDSKENLSDPYFNAVKSGDMVSAQEMVNAAARSSGYDKGPMFHGSAGGDFTSFKIPSSGFNSNVFGSWEVSRHAAFFTPSQEAAESYSTQGGKSGRVRTFFLSGDFLDMRRGLTEASFNGLVANGVNERWLIQQAGKWEFGELFDSEQDPDNVFTKAMLAIGYNGAIILDTDGILGFDTYVVLTPNQIKSADAVTYDDSGEVIPLSKRFDEGNVDIRF